MADQEIARVESSFIGFEDHGMLSVSLGFTYGGSGQGMAHRAFGASDESQNPDAWRLGHEMGMDMIRRLMLACGVSEWAKIVGRIVLVTHDWTSIFRIDPLPTERGEPFDVQSWADSFAVRA